MCLYMNQSYRQSVVNIRCLVHSGCYRRLLLCFAFLICQRQGPKTTILYLLILRIVFVCHHITLPVMMTDYLYHSVFSLHLSKGIWYIDSPYLMYLVKTCGNILLLLKWLLILKHQSQQRFMKSNRKFHTSTANKFIWWVFLLILITP